jgi:hypothetical protein
MKEQEKKEYLDTVQQFGRVFFNRTDEYAIQTPEGSYLFIQRQVTVRLLISHLKGRLTLGTYLLSKEATSKFAVLDVDSDESRRILFQIHSAFPLPSYLEASRRGGHLWFFFAEPVEGEQAKAFGMEIVRRYDLPSEVFPKQARSEGPGSCIRLPFGIHRKTGDRYPFVGLGDWRAQLNALSHPETIPLEEVLKYQYVEPQHTRTAPTLINGELPIWEKIKREISIEGLISQYVELDTKGRGHCLFHDDVHPSFSVNSKEGYWHCFSGCGGGSVIDFWMKLKGMTFMEAVEDLAERFAIE